VNSELDVCVVHCGSLFVSFGSVDSANFRAVFSENPAQGNSNFLGEYFSQLKQVLLPQGALENYSLRNEDFPTENLRRCSSVGHGTFSQSKARSSLSDLTDIRSNYSV